jgi:hypothetical protein
VSTRAWAWSGSSRSPSSPAPPRPAPGVCGVGRVAWGRLGVGTVLERRFHRQRTDRGAAGRAPTSALAARATKRRLPLPSTQAVVDDPRPGSRRPEAIAQANAGRPPAVLAKRSSQATRSALSQRTKSASGSSRTFSRILRLAEPLTGAVTVNRTHPCTGGSARSVQRERRAGVLFEVKGRDDPQNQACATVTERLAHQGDPRSFRAGA